uniref:Uncharacterized protein n=1 Tax=Anguilla anguilla TaxID=7936 RepID=A0A0E9S9M3_ANGAN
MIFLFLVQNSVAKFIAMKTILCEQLFIQFQNMQTVQKIAIRQNIWEKPK